MLKRAAAYALAIALGLSVGALSAARSAGLLGGAAFDAGSVVVGRWHSDFAIGTAAADPYTRARVAKYGLLALGRSEAVYFTTAVDDSGERLREACRYRISGGPMPAQWWSVTLYDGDSRLPMNDDGALSIDASRVGSRASWTAIVAPVKPASGLWISSRKGGNFDLTLRLYEAQPALFANPTRVLKAPTITRLDCGGGKA